MRRFGEQHGMHFSTFLEELYGSPERAREALAKTFVEDLDEFLR